ncbi:hypothetical protein E2542_SST27395 [Spatholobus suberectus]|nr:hypothetical protein E2542_SST27395 [Spatholobus suberectus]
MIFLLQFLIPVVTNSGHCTTLNKYLTGVLLVCIRYGSGTSCMLSLVVFIVLGLLDTNTVRRFYLRFESGEKI